MAYLKAQGPLESAKPFTPFDAFIIYQIPNCDVYEIFFARLQAMSKTHLTQLYDPKS